MPAAGAGTVTVIVPVGTAQVGCVVTLAVGADPADGAAFTVTAVAADIHPEAFLTVTLYGPGATPVKMPLVLV